LVGGAVESWLTWANILSPKNRRKKTNKVAGRNKQLKEEMFFNFFKTAFVFGFIRPDIFCKILSQCNLLT